MGRKACHSKKFNRILKITENFEDVEYFHEQKIKCQVALPIQPCLIILQLLFFIAHIIHSILKFSTAV